MEESQDVLGVPRPGGRPGTFSVHLRAPPDAARRVRQPVGRGRGDRRSNGSARSSSSPPGPRGCYLGRRERLLDVRLRQAIDHSFGRSATPGGARRATEERPVGLSGRAVRQDLHLGEFPRRPRGRLGVAHLPRLLVLGESPAPPVRNAAGVRYGKQTIVPLRVRLPGRDRGRPGASSRPSRRSFSAS